MSGKVHSNGVHAFSKRVICEFTFLYLVCVHLYINVLSFKLFVSRK
jgi:hypothetical protein